MLYKVGDRVKIGNIAPGVYRDDIHFLTGMSCYCGTYVTIAEVRYAIYGVFYLIEEDNLGHGWYEMWFAKDRLKKLNRVLK